MTARDALDLTVQTSLSREEKALAPSRKMIRAWARAALLEGRAEVAIRLVGESEGHELNLTYRGKDYATNVLSFPAELPAGVDLPILGDIVICAPVVQREARVQGKDCRAHFAHLTVHGVLHLLGFDHEDPREAQSMEALERDILASLGFDDPYDDEA